MDTKPEVDDFNVVSIIDQYVLKFQIPVTDPLVMQIADAEAKLAKEMLCNLFWDNSFIRAFISDILIQVNS
jgi:hypothetical protein